MVIATSNRLTQCAPINDKTPEARDTLKDNLSNTTKDEKPKNKKNSTTKKTLEQIKNEYELVQKRKTLLIKIAKIIQKSPIIERYEIINYIDNYKKIIKTKPETIEKIFSIEGVFPNKIIDNDFINEIMKITEDHTSKNNKTGKDNETLLEVKEIIDNITELEIKLRQSRNKFSARKYRTKKRSHTDSLPQTEQALSEENKKLKHKVNQLEEALVDAKLQLMPKIFINQIARDDSSFNEFWEALVEKFPNLSDTFKVNARKIIQNKLSVIQG